MPDSLILRAFALFVRVLRVLLVLLVIVVGLWTWNAPIHSAKWRVQEALNISAGARTAFGIACMEDRLRPGLRNEDPEFGLKKPLDYALGPLYSVSLATTDANTGTLTAVFKAVTGPFIFGLGRRTFIKDEATLIFRGVCGSNGGIFFIDPASTVAQKFWPKGYKIYPGVVDERLVAGPDASRKAEPALRRDVAKGLSARELTDLRERPGRPACHVGEPGVEKYTAHDPRYVVESTKTEIKTVSNLVNVKFSKGLKDEDIVDVICRVNGTIASYLPGFDLYVIKIPDTMDLKLLETTLEKLRNDPRVRSAEDVIIIDAVPAAH